MDGSPYTWQDFEQWYGSEAARCWSEAGATEHGGDPARPLPPPTGAGATEHGRGAGATEHNPVTILSLQDLRGLARQQTRGEARGSPSRSAPVAKSDSQRTLRHWTRGGSDDNMATVVRLARNPTDGNTIVRKRRGRIHSRIHREHQRSQSRRSSSR